MWVQAGGLFLLNETRRCCSYILLEEWSYSRKYGIHYLGDEQTPFRIFLGKWRVKVQCVHVVCIISHELYAVESDEQRDSAVSCSSMDSNLRFSDNQLCSFPMPEPFVHTHSVDNTQYPTVLAKMRDILTTCRQKVTAGDKGLTQSLGVIENNHLSCDVTSKVNALSQSLGLIGNNHLSCDVEVTNALSTAPSSSRTSLDSTGSSGLADQNKLSPGDPKLMTGNEADAESKSCGEESGLMSLLHTNGVVNGHMTGYQNHAASTPSSRTGSPIRSEGVNGETKGSTSVPSLHNHKVHQQLVNCKNDDYSSKLSMDTNPSCDRVSITSSEDRVSECGSTHEPVPYSSALASAPLRTNSSPNRRLLDRRQTCPTGMLNLRRPNFKITNCSSASFSTSPSSTKRYTNVSGQPVGIRSNLASIKVKIRRNPSRTGTSSIKRKSARRPTLPIVQNNPTTKLLKVILAGNDNLVSQVAKAYAHLQVEEPNLLNGIELRFYHVPLSRASLLHTNFPELSRSMIANQTHGGGGGGGGVGCSELPEPMFEQVDFSGNDVHIGRFLAHMDSWYERNLMMAVHHLLRLLPSVSDVSQ